MPTITALLICSNRKTKRHVGIYTYTTKGINMRNGKELNCKQLRINQARTLK